MTKESLYRDTNIPLPSKPLIILEDDSVEVVCSKIDNYFEDIIRDYPQATQELVRDMYYKNTNVESVENLFQEQNVYARGGVRTEENHIIAYIMKIDSDLIDCPVVTRWLKMHEVACHIGQIHQRVNNVGMEEWQKEVENGNLGRFMEQSVVLAEKVLTDAIPDSIIERDLKNADWHIQLPLAIDILDRKNLSFKDYFRLEGLLHAPVPASVTEEDHELLHSRPDVQKFCAQISTANAYKIRGVPYTAKHKSSPSTPENIRSQQTVLSEEERNYH